MADLYRGVQEMHDISFLQNFPHYIASSHNLNDIEEIFEDSSHTLPYSCMQALPFLPPSKSSAEVLRGEDPVLCLVKKKQRWKEKIMENSRKGKMAAKKIDPVLNDLISSHKGKEVVPGDSYCVKLLGSDPDEHFDGAYNWYYTGGCLDKLEMDGKILLLTTQGKKRNKLRVVPLKAKNVWQASLKAAKTVSCGAGAIHQLRGTYKQDKGFIGVRLHKECHLYSFTPNLQLERVHKAKSDCPFVGLDVNQHSAGKYCTITSKRNVAEWDVNSGIHLSRSVYTKKTFTDNLCSVSYCSDPHTIMMTDRKGTYFLDNRFRLRTNLEIRPKKVSHLLEYCEDLSLVSQSCVFPHAVYMCTSHHVLLYDTRNSSKPLQRWTHLLCFPPMYSCTISPESGQELLCIGNQKPGEVVMILNNWEEEVPHSQVPPFSLPNLQDALHSAHKQGLWLHPCTQQRVKLSTTGLVWLPPIASKLTLLSQTAAGDVFNHVLTHRHKLPSSDKKVNDNSEIVNDYLETRDLKCLSKWEGQLLKTRCSGVLKATTRKNMNRAFRGLRSCKRKFRQDKVIKSYKNNRWKMSKQVMQTCVDAMAPRILAIWEVEDEPEWSHADTVSTSHDKVRAWLDAQPSQSSTEKPLSQVSNTELQPRDLTRFAASTPYSSYKAFDLDETSQEEVSWFQAIRSNNKRTPLTRSTLFVDGF